MKTYSTDAIRNVALLGHSNSGKTTLTEAALFLTGVTNRQGKVDDGNTTSDFDKEEIIRKVSIGTTSIPYEWKDRKVNLLDTPGYFDFIGEMYGAKRASEGSVLVIDTPSGIEVGTEKAWKNLEKYTTPRILFLNKLDKEDSDFYKSLDLLRDKFGDKIIPFTIPIGRGEDFKGFTSIMDEKAFTYNGNGLGQESEIIPEHLELLKTYKETLLEKIAETDEVLMEKYFAGEEYSKEDICRGLKLAIRNGDLVPLTVGSCEKNIGVDFLMDMILELIPSPKEINPLLGNYDIESMDRKVDVREPFSAIIFKTIIDPFVGKISLFKVISGKLTRDTEVYNATKDRSEKLGGLYILRGKEQIEVDEIIAGDIGATTKLNYSQTGDTLCDYEDKILYDKIEYPQPTLFMAVYPKKKEDEEKIGVSLQKLIDEDPSFVLERNKETKELLIGGQGNMQLVVIVAKLKNAFGVDVELRNPKIAFRETIKKKSDVQGRHKKQSGGAGQYGDVHIRFEPCEEEFIFEEEVFGGAVPRNYFPAVEKGIQESMEKGVLAGYPVVNIRATLYDGSYHPVDSNEMAFKIAASMAFKKGMEEAEPILLEPILRLEINIPEEYLGDIMGDMNKRRGKILGMEQLEDGGQLVIAEAPHMELFQYAIDLRAMTQARGSFKMDFLRYDEAPKDLLSKLIS